jgi:hypothetical protein
VAKRPQSTIAKLLQTGYEYTVAYTSAVSSISITGDAYPNQFHSLRTHSLAPWLSIAEMVQKRQVFGTITLGIDQSTQSEAAARAFQVQKVWHTRDTTDASTNICIRSTLRGVD